MDYEEYVEALNSCSIESAEARLEKLRSKGQLSDEDLKALEALPLRSKFVSYAYAILTCAHTTEQAKAYARQLLRTWA